MGSNSGSLPKCVNQSGQGGLTLMPENRSWYAIRVRSKWERPVAAALAAKGYEQFLPLYGSTRQWADRAKAVELPLFPTYLFCRFDVSDRLLPILTTPGLMSIVGHGRNPVSIPSKEIEAIQSVSRSGLYARPWPQLTAGSKVLVEKGPLAGIEGVTLDAGKKYKLMISIPLLQRSVAVEIDRNWVRPLAGSSTSKR